MQEQNSKKPSHPLPDMAGRTVGRLTILRQDLEKKTVNKGRHWICKCECGVTKSVGQWELKCGKTKSCGCLQREYARSQKTGVKHGLDYHPLMSTWRQLIARCYNPKSTSYPNYGAKGIKVCDRWRNDPAAFFEDMGLKPSPKLSVDRIDNRGDYTPENCRWATIEIQCRNTSSNVWIEYQSKRMTVTDWAKYLGLKRYVLDNRIRAGWPVDRVLSSHFFDSAGNPIGRILKRATSTAGQEPPESNS